MKHLKTSHLDLRELFERNITARHIAEPFTSFDSDALSSVVHKFMKDHDYDVVGVRCDGFVVGYVRSSDLSEEKISRHTILFLPSDLVDDTTPLLATLSLMRESPRLFVRVFGQVDGIVTLGDLQKAPVRMWLFGLIYLVEIQLLRIIREGYPDDSWKQFITSKRLNLAENIRADRQQRNVAIDLADCLQFADKREIISDSDTLRSAIGLPDKKQTEVILKEMEQVRNNLAHAQDIVTGYWPKLVDLAEQAEALLHTCEQVTVKPTNTT